jgi:hypothetical protein
MQRRKEKSTVRFLDSDSDAKSDRTPSSQGTVVSPGLPSQTIALLIDSLPPDEIAADDPSLQWEVLFKYGVLPHADVYQLIRVTDDLFEELKKKTAAITAREEHIDFIKSRKIPLEDNGQQLTELQIALTRNQEERARIDAHIKLIQAIPYKILDMIKAEPQPLQNRDALLELVLLSKLHNEAYVINLLKYLIPSNLIKTKRCECFLLAISPIYLYAG